MSCNRKPDDKKPCRHCGKPKDEHHMSVDFITLDDGRTAVPLPNHLQHRFEPCKSRTDWANYATNNFPVAESYREVEQFADAQKTWLGLKDSGNRTSLAGTGELKDIPPGRGRYDLIPPEALEALAKLYELGAQKYSARNWEKGRPLWVYLDSTIRHIKSLLEGDTNEPHDVQAAWNLLGFITTKKRIIRGALKNDALLDQLPDALYDAIQLELNLENETGGRH